MVINIACHWLGEYIEYLQCIHNEIADDLAFRNSVNHNNLNAVLIVCVVSQKQISKAMLEVHHKFKLSLQNVLIYVKKKIFKTLSKSWQKCSLSCGI